MSMLADKLRSAGVPDPQGPRRVPISRASFALTDRTAFPEAVRLATQWVQETIGCRLSDGAMIGEPVEVINGNDLSAASTSRVDDSQGSIWAAQVEYRGDKTGRVWKTDLFVEQRVGAFARFGAQLACEANHTKLNFEHTRPRVIQQVLARLAAEADGKEITNSIIPVQLEDVDDLTSLLYDPLRRLPVVIVSVDDSGRAQIDLNKLATRLSGTAHLRSCAVEESFELSRNVGQRLSTYNGAIRVYMPGLEEGAEDPFQHPLWLAPANGWNPRALNQIAARVLPLGFRDSDGDARFWRIGLIRQATARAIADAKLGNREEQLMAEVLALRSELENAQEAAASAEALMNEEAIKNGRLEAEIARVQEANFGLRERVRYNDQTPPSASNNLSPTDAYSLFEQNPSLEASLRVIATLFPDRVSVLETAYESARDSYAFLHRKRAFGLLWALATDYWSALKSGIGDGSARQCFGAAFAAKEAESISAAGLRRRTFNYAGVELLMEKHLKIGVADNKAETLRVHFDWVAGSSKIVIGHCGGHLDF